MKKRVLPILLSLCLMASMLPTALAADTDTPSAEQISISAEGSSTPMTSVPDGQALRMDIPNDVVLDLGSIGMTTNMAVTLGNVPTSDSNTIYADGTNLKIALSVKGASNTVNAAMSTTDGIQWTGEGDVPDREGVTDLPIGALANELGDTNISVAPGVLVAGDQQSVAATVGLNQDAENVYLYLYPASLDTCTVTYNYGSGSYTFTVPEGSALVDAQVPVLTGQTFSGWKTADGAEAPLGQPVTADLTLSGTYTSQPGTTSFDNALTKLLNGDASGLVEGALPISNTADFAAFVARAEEVPAGQLVRLRNNIDLGDNSYSAISGFKGDFDGDNHIISDGTFTAVTVDDATCAGMFAKLGAYNGRGQRVVNLTLDNVTVNANGADYAGILVGNASGSETSEDKMVLIQNVQVKDSDVNARSAGGIAGFAIWTSIRFCSSDELTNVTCMVNGGGIAGISYGRIRDCYSRAIIDSTLPIFYTIGGIVGKNLESGVVEHCWTPLAEVSGQNSQATTPNNQVNVTLRYPSNSVFSDMGMGVPYWNTGAGFSHGFTDAVFFDEWGV